MTARTILGIYLILFGAEFIFHQVLNLLNLRSSRGALTGTGIDPALAETGLVDEKTLRKSVRYVRANMIFIILRTFLASAVVLTLVLSGAFGIFDRLFLGAGLQTRVHGIVYIFIIALGSTVISLPLSLYHQFVIEKKFGFSTTTAGTFFLDLIKGLVLSGVLMSALLYALFLFIDLFPDWWWLFAFGFIALFQLLINVLYPVVIAPIFNKFTPLKEGPLRERLNRLAERLSFRVSGIFVMDGSRRSRHSNAYFTGVGKVKRIVLFDTLIDKLENDEIEAVLAHEIGHEKMRHTVKNFAVSLLVLGAGLFLISRVIGYAPLYRAFGFAGPAPYRLLVVLGFLSGPLTFLFKPVLTGWSRKFEYQADRFAARNVDSKESMKRGLIKLNTDNLSNLRPHPLYSFYHYSHPAPAERLRALD